MKKRGKRQEIERYMEETHIDIMTIQETNIGDGINEQLKNNRNTYGITAAAV